ncbi:LysR family transcriptional regulator [Advenella sp. RU8]|uniref:LysR family transcriptional regulator n=1 Tax=Advenella sp. RU8 TaxID=3399575 RepID=UPI003AB08F9E
MTDIDLRILRYFIAVAEELNFSKAALRLNISQPPLSFAIKQLEQALDLILFERNSRQVVLTNAGIRLYKEALFILGHANSLKHTLHHAEARPPIRIGFVGSMQYRNLAGLLTELKRQFPDLTFALTEANSSEIIHDTDRGNIDIGFTHANQIPVDIESQTLMSEPFLLCLPRNSPHARKKSLDLAALKHENFIFFSRSVSPAYYEMLLSMCVSAGFFPKANDEARHWLSITSMVSQNLGVSIVPSCMQHCGLPNLKFLPFKHTQRSVTDVIWSDKKEKELKQEIVDFAARFYASF